VPNVHADLVASDEGRLDALVLAFHDGVAERFAENLTHAAQATLG
jgi:hypothetical protein